MKFLEPLFEFGDRLLRLAGADQAAAEPDVAGGLLLRAVKRFGIVRDRFFKLIASEIDLAEVVAELRIVRIGFHPGDGAIEAVLFTLLFELGDLRLRLVVGGGVALELPDRLIDLGDVGFFDALVECGVECAEFLRDDLEFPLCRFVILGHHVGVGQLATDIHGVVGLEIFREFFNQHFRLVGVVDRTIHQLLGDRGLGVGGLALRGAFLLPLAALDAGKGDGAAQLRLHRQIGRVAFGDLLKHLQRLAGTAVALKRLRHAAGHPFVVRVELVKYFESFRRDEHRITILPGVGHGEQDQRIVHTVSQRPFAERERAVGVANRLEFDQQEGDGGEHHPECAQQWIHSAGFGQLKLAQFLTCRRHLGIFANHFDEGANGAIQIGRRQTDGMVVGIAHIDRRLFECFSIHSLNSGCFRCRRPGAEDDEKSNPQRRPPPVISFPGSRKPLYQGNLHAIVFFSSTGADFFHIPEQKNELRAVNPGKSGIPNGMRTLFFNSPSKISFYGCFSCFQVPKSRNCDPFVPHLCPRKGPAIPIKYLLWLDFDRGFPNFFSTFSS